MGCCVGCVLFYVGDYVSYSVGCFVQRFHTLPNTGTIPIVHKTVPVMLQSCAKGDTPL